MTFNPTRQLINLLKTLACHQKRQQLVCLYIALVTKHHYNVVCLKKAWPGNSFLWCRDP